MKDPADKHTPELLEQLLASVEPAPEFELRVREFIARGQATQRAVDELGAGPCVSAGGHTWEAPIVAANVTPYGICVWCRRQVALPPKPRRVRTGGASKSASRSADKPERSAK